MSGNPNINNAFSNYVKHNWTWIEITKSPAIEIFTTTNAMEKVSKCDSTVLVCDGDKYMHMDYRYMVNGFKFLLPNKTANRMTKRTVVRASGQYKRVINRTLETDSCMGPLWAWITQYCFDACFLFINLLLLTGSTKSNFNSIHSCLRCKYEM